MYKISFRFPRHCHLAGTQLIRKFWKREKHKSVHIVNASNDCTRYIATTAYIIHKTKGYTIEKSLKESKIDDNPVNNNGIIRKKGIKGEMHKTVLRFPPFVIIIIYIIL